VPELTEQVLINVPVARVFARLAEPERAPEWTPNLLRAERASQVEAGPGLETILLARVGGHEVRGRGRCLAWDPPRQMVLESSLEICITSKTTFDLDEQAHGTLVVARVEYSLPPKGLGRLVGGLLGQTLARRDLRQALRNLKSQLEAEGLASGGVS